jgi:hypothetical protein
MEYKRERARTGTNPYAEIAWARVVFLDNHVIGTLDPKLLASSKRTHEIPSTAGHSGPRKIMMMGLRGRTGYVSSLKARIVRFRTAQGQRSTA